MRKRPQTISEDSGNYSLSKRCPPTAIDTYPTDDDRETEEEMGGRPVKIGETWKDELPGGRGDKRKPSDFDPEQVKKGTKHEMEHTGDQKLAREIAIDPLSEDPKYYDYLKESIVPSMRSLFIESLLKEATLRDQFDESYPDGKCPRKWVEKLMRTHKMNWVDYAKENRLPLTIPEQVEWEPLLDWMGY